MILIADRAAPRRVLTALVLGLTVAVSGVIDNPRVSAFQSVPEGSRRTGLLDMGMGLASIVPASLWDAIGQPQTINDGGDGVLNVLLLGSDARSGGISRTDTIMVVSLKTINNVKTIRAASIPRDTTRIPNPFTASTTDTFKGRINTILKTLKQDDTVEHALVELEIVIEQLLGIPIDYHALITFNGFHAMVDVVDPITITTKEIRDSKYWDDPTRTPGVYFPAQANYQLYAYQPNATPPLCNGKWKTQGISNQSLWCRRAMPYVRSRKGSGNSDFKRASRQQDFVHATVRRVAQLGTAQLQPLLNQANGQVTAKQLYTNIPRNIPDLTQLYTRLQGAQFGNHVVFAPSTYSTHIPGTTAYQLKLPAVRTWADINLQ